jgi:hypothetical protein
VPNGYADAQPAGTGAFPPNRIFELSVGYVTGQRVISLPLGDVGNSQAIERCVVRLKCEHLDGVSHVSRNARSADRGGQRLKPVVDHASDDNAASARYARVLRENLRWDEYMVDACSFSIRWGIPPTGRSCGWISYPFYPPPWKNLPSSKEPS